MPSRSPRSSPIGAISTRLRSSKAPMRPGASRCSWLVTRRSCHVLARVHVEGLAGDGAGAVGAEEDRRLGDVLVGRDLTEGHAGGDLADLLRLPAAAGGHLPLH